MFSFRENFGGGHKIGGLLLLIPALLIFASDAQAHAKLLRSTPADGEVLRQAPKTVELVFSQNLQNGAMNSLLVTDENGRRVDKNIISIFEDGKKIQIELENLNSGIYKVEWKALSTDEHLMKGSFSFSLAPAAGETQAAVSQPPPNDLPKTFAPPQKLPKQESAMNRAQTFARWLANLAMTMLFGGFAFLLFVLKPSLRTSANFREAEQTAASFARGKNIFTRLAWFNLVLLFVSAAAALILQTSVVFDRSVSRALAPAAFLRILTETSFGAPWLFGIALTASLSAVVFFINRESRKDDLSSGKIWLLWLGLGACALMFFAASLSGHARAAAREYPFAVVAQWLHLIAAGIWLGGLFHLALILPKIVKRIDGGRRAVFLADSISRFSRLAVVFSILLALTGVYSSWLHVPDFSALWTTVYGFVLTAKIGVFLLMLAFGGLNSFVLRPPLERLTETPDSENEILRRSRNFYRAVTIEALLGAIALLLAAALAFIPLAHQH